MVNSKAIQFSNSQVEFIPKEIYAKFPNLESLGIVESIVKIQGQDFFNGSGSLKKLDLKFNKLQYLPDDTFNLLPNLEMLKLFGNQLEYIGRDLFSKNSKLVFIDLQQNNVNMIDPRTFDTLTNLKYFWMKGNICSNKNFEFNNDDQLDVLKKVIKRCFENFQASGSIYRGIKRLEQRGLDKSLLLEIQEVSRKILDLNGNFTKIHKEVADVKEIDGHLNRIDKKLLMYHDDGTKNRKENFETLKKKLNGLQTTEWKKVFQRLAELDKTMASLGTQITEIKKIEANFKEIKKNLKEVSENGTLKIEKSGENQTELEQVVLKKISVSLVELTKAITTLNETSSNPRCSKIEAESEKKEKDDDDDFKEDFKYLKKLFTIIGGLMIVVLFSQILIMCCVCSIANRQKKYRKCEELTFRNLETQHDGNSVNLWISGIISKISWSF